MAKRLVEQYQVGDTVEISFGDEVWQRGVVVRHDYPAIWVQTQDGRSWFVTNTRRIRSLNDTGL